MGWMDMEKILPSIDDSRVTNQLDEGICITEGIHAGLNGDVGLYICYESEIGVVVPLWRYGQGDFVVYAPVPGEDEPFILVCQDECGDFYTYGMWKTLDDLIEWLNNPKPLY